MYIVMKYGKGIKYTDRLKHDEYAITVRYMGAYDSIDDAKFEIASDICDGMPMLKDEPDENYLTAIESMAKRLVTAVTHDDMLTILSTHKMGDDFYIAIDMDHLAYNPVDLFTINFPFRGIKL